MLREILRGAFFFVMILDFRILPFPNHASNGEENYRRLSCVVVVVVLLYWSFLYMMFWLKTKNAIRKSAFFFDLVRCPVCVCTTKSYLARLALFSAMIIHRLLASIHIIYCKSLHCLL